MAFLLSLHTPNGSVVKNLECKEILIPTERGMIDILPNHTHLMSQLGVGVMTVKTAQDKLRHFSITAGVLKVLKDKVTVLSITSEMAEKIDIERAKRAKEIAQEKLSGKDPLTDIELIKYQRKLERAEVRLKMAYLR